MYLSSHCGLNKSKTVEKIIGSFAEISSDETRREMGRLLANKMNAVMNQMGKLKKLSNHVSLIRLISVQLEV